MKAFRSICTAIDPDFVGKSNELSGLDIIGETEKPFQTRTL